MSTMSEPQIPPRPYLYGRKLITVIPAYNEERTIAQTVAQAKPYADIVIVVDDGSEDDTTETAQLSGAHVINHDQNKGRGSAQITGLTHALQYGADIVLLINAGSHYQIDDVLLSIAPILENQTDIVMGWPTPTAQPFDPNQPHAEKDLAMVLFSAEALQRVLFDANGRFQSADWSKLTQDTARVVKVPIAISRHASKTPFFVRLKQHMRSLFGIKEPPSATSFFHIEGH